MRTNRLARCAAALFTMLFAAGVAVSSAQDVGPPNRSTAADGRSAEPSRAADTQVPASSPNLAQSATAALAAAVAIDGPDAPMAPSVMTRDERGRVTIRAVRIDRPINLDGRINEELYALATPISDFYQQVPIEGAEASEPTEAWVFYDDDNLYLSFRCIDSQPSRIVATEMRRDGGNIWQADDSVTVTLDTFYDRRNGLMFQTNALGAIRDQAIVDGQYIESWNTIWNVRSTRFEGGWSTEIVIPFKSLRYRSSGPQVWGINFRRVIRWKNEYATLTAVPASYGGMGVSQMGVAGTLVGVETPAQSMNLELKPYVASSVTTDRTAAIPFSNDATQNVGVDFKYGLTRGLIADVTVNTDFAQVEEDLQQVNLTRFSLFFPEKRDFFMEGQGVYGFGGRTAEAQGDVPVLFFSRRVGLSSGQSVPVVAGARVSGRTGPFEIGVLNIQTAEKESASAVPTNYSAVRIKRDIFRRSSFGILATDRVPTSGGGDRNLAFGADTNLRFYDNLFINAYYARTTPEAGVEGDPTSFRGQFDYAGDRYGVMVDHLMVGRRFDPAVGFLRRDDFRRSSASLRFSPRTANNRLIRRFNWQSSMDYITDADVTRVENRSFEGSFTIEFHSSDSLRIQYNRDYEWLPDDFEIASDVTVPAGSFSTTGGRISYTIGGQRKVSGQVAFANGSFYGGTKREASYSGRVAIAPQLALEPSISLNWVDLPYGAFTAGLVSTRVIVTPTPFLAISSLVQVNTSNQTASSSVRFRWEYQSGSDLFVVYSDGRDTSRPGFPDLMNRSFAVKLTRLVRF